MKCRKCGCENSESDDFCHNCGKRLIKPKQVILALAIVAIILACIAIFSSGVLTPQIPLEKQDFQGFSIDVPKGSDFLIDEQITTDPSRIFIMYVNHGDYSDDVNTMFVGNNMSKAFLKEDEYLGNEGDMEIYRNGSIYGIYEKFDNTQVYIFGYNLDALKNVISTYDEDDFEKLASDYVKTTQEI